MNQLGMFAKYWEPGRVKTRLAAAIGDQAAQQPVPAVRADAVAATCRSSPSGAVLAYTPAERRTEFESLSPDGWLLAAQADGDLGQRMQDYFADAFRRGATRVVLIGSDSPNLPVDYVNDAFQQLDKYPVVLGPADDGGYYLVGAAGSVPPIFKGIEWGSSQVWTQTVNCCATRTAPMACCRPGMMLTIWQVCGESIGTWRTRSRLTNRFDACART